MSKWLQPIGVYVISSTMTVCLYAIDYVEDRVRVSTDGKKYEWCPITEQINCNADELEMGFLFGEWFVPFAEVMRI